MLPFDADILLNKITVNLLSCTVLLKECSQSGKQYLFYI